MSYNLYEKIIFSGYLIEKLTLEIIKIAQQFLAIKHKCIKELLKAKECGETNYISALEWLVN